MSESDPQSDISTSNVSSSSSGCGGAGLAGGLLAEGLVARELPAGYLPSWEFLGRGLLAEGLLAERWSGCGRLGNEGLLSVSILPAAQGLNTRFINTQSSVDTQGSVQFPRSCNSTLACGRVHSRGRSTLWLPGCSVSSSEKRTALLSWDTSSSVTNSVLQHPLTGLDPRSPSSWWSVSDEGNNGSNWESTSCWDLCFKRFLHKVLNGISTSELSELDKTCDTGGFPLRLLTRGFTSRPLPWGLTLRPLTPGFTPKPLTRGFTPRPLSRGFTPRPSLRPPCLSDVLLYVDPVLWPVLAVALSPIGSVTVLAVSVLCCTLCHSLGNNGSSFPDVVA